MKLLDVDGFAAVNAVMGMAKGRSCDVSGRLEAYSCKRVREDKKLARKIQDRSAPAEGRSPLIFAQEADPEDLADDCLGSFTMTPSMTDFGGSPSKDQLVWSKQFPQHITLSPALSCGQHFKRKAEIAQCCRGNLKWMGVLHVANLYSGSYGVLIQNQFFGGYTIRKVSVAMKWVFIPHQFFLPP